MSDQRTLKFYWQVASGLPYHGWRRVAHSILVPIVATYALAYIAGKVFG